MKALYIKYKQKDFWKDYWNEFGVDYDEFKDLDMYPIKMVQKYIKKSDKIFECGFGAGRVIRHLSKYSYNVEGIEYDNSIVGKLEEADSALRISQGDILDLKFEDNHFDTVLCFGVICGLHKNVAKAISELKRVTKDGGIIIISVMLYNIARIIQKFLCNMNNKGLKNEFYAWMNTRGGWKNYFETFALDVVDSQEIVSKYNIYYWAKFLRSSKEKTDLKLARVKDDEYKLNILGEVCFLIHKKVFRNQLASGVTFVLKNRKSI